MLYGYGGFEISLQPGYSALIGNGWLARGGTWVLANIRGGGEFGPQWHQAALKEHRQRAFDDFIAVAEDLIARKLTSPPHLGIVGGSNGGLLVGAVMVQRPDLFGAVVAQVPLLDMKRYNKLLAGASWMGEYGDPDKPEEWAYISKYSPYQNVKKEVDLSRVAAHHHDARRSRASGTCAKDVRAHEGAGTRRPVLRECRRRPWRGLEHGAAGAELGLDVHLPLGSAALDPSRASHAKPAFTVRLRTSTLGATGHRERHRRRLC